MYNSVVSQVVQPSPQSNSRAPSACQTYNHYMVIPYPPTPWQPFFPLSVSVDLPILDISYKWDYITAMALCIWCLSLSIVFSRFTHVTAYIKTSFFSMAPEEETWCLSNWTPGEDPYVLTF